MVPDRLQLAARPTAQPLSPFPPVDPQASRVAVRGAWRERPLAVRREALAQLLRKVTLSPGGVKITYAYCHHEPSGPPYGSWVQWGVEVEAGQ